MRHSGRDVLNTILWGIHKTNVFIYLNSEILEISNRNFTTLSILLCMKRDYETHEKLCYCCRIFRYFCVTEFTAELSSHRKKRGWQDKKSDIRSYVFCVICLLAFLRNRQWKAKWFMLFWNQNHYCIYSRLLVILRIRINAYFSTFPECSDDVLVWGPHHHNHGDIFAYSNRNVYHIPLQLYY